MIVILLCVSFQTALSAENKQTLTIDQLATSTEKHNSLDDFKTSISYMGKASYLQFSTTQNLVLLGIATGAVAYFLHHDDQIANKAMRNHKNKGIFHTISDSAILFNTPIVPLIFYSMGRNNNDEKMIRFSQEHLAALGLGLIETVVISAVPFHERPSTQNLAPVEKYLRGKSSFPSGHVIGYSVLSFKTFQFYGPIAALAPALGMVITSYERIQSEKHYASDVIASAFLSLLASEGVRMASNYDKNHPIYNWIFAHNLNINYIKNNEIPGISISLNY